jgi:putative addiction module antidote
MTTTQITLRKIGGSVGATLPKDIVDDLHVAAGDTLTVIRTDRGILLTPYDPVFEQAMRAFAEVNERYRNALRELASK